VPRHAAPADRRSGEPPAHVGTLLRVASQWVSDEIFDEVVAAGYDDLGAAHVALFRHPGTDGFRPSQLAERLGVTKQSVNDLLGHLERRGYLVRVADTSDRRARVIRLTAKGRQLHASIDAAASGAQHRIAEVLGQDRFDNLHRSLELLAEQLATPTQVVGGRTARR
jgi:DNA-binding MarR family transcriptional regulator